MSRTFKRKAQGKAGKLAMLVLSRLSKYLTPARIDRYGAKLGNLIYIASKRYRRVVLRNLAAAYPGWGAEKVRRVGRETFRHFARGTLEFFHLLNLTPEQVDESVEIEGREYLDAALENGHGAIIVTAHYGNWELFARKIVLMGYKLNVIARNSDDPTMTGVANRVRESGGYKVFGRDSAAIPALRCLRRNELLGILPDQNTLSGIFVDFFGRPVATATGPAIFALRSDAPIICGFAKRLGNGRFKATLYPPLKVPLTGDEDADVHAITQSLTKAIENEIREDPTQWLWLHDRWKRTAEAEG
jgi:KDO2-lipid IV(A) lauroyltransferase